MLCPFNSSSSRQTKYIQIINSVDLIIFIFFWLASEASHIKGIIMWARFARQKGGLYPTK